SSLINQYPHWASYRIVRREKEATGTFERTETYKRRQTEGLIRFAGHYKIFCVNGKYGIQVEFRIFYFIALQNEEDYERKESSSA
ncbi:UNVERIFIED_CONTAM: hypothetical protein NY100_11375, partial [Prevotella sp. 15_C9]